MKVKYALEIEKTKFKLTFKDISIRKDVTILHKSTNHLINPLIYEI